jgi:copper chaperone CopZ
MANMELKIKGMTCNHCQMRVKKALESIDGIDGADVDYRKGTAKISVQDESKVNMSKIAEVIEDTGYELVK